MATNILKNIQYAAAAAALSHHDWNARMQCKFASRDM